MAAGSEASARGAPATPGKATAAPGPADWRGLRSARGTGNSEALHRREGAAAPSQTPPRAWAQLEGVEVAEGHEDEVAASTAAAAPWAAGGALGPSGTKGSKAILIENVSKQ